MLILPLHSSTTNSYNQVKSIKSEMKIFTARVDYFHTVHYETHLTPQRFDSQIATLIKHTETFTFLQ